MAALDHLAIGIRGYHDSGNSTSICTPLAILATLLNRLGRHEPAATIAGFALSPLALSVVPELAAVAAGLRDVLGGRTYESFAARGEAMTMAEIAAYAYEQIEQARVQLQQLR